MIFLFARLITIYNGYFIAETLIAVQTELMLVLLPVTLQMLCKRQRGPRQTTHEILDQTVHTTVPL